MLRKQEKTLKNFFEAGTVHPTSSLYHKSFNSQIVGSHFCEKKFKNFSRVITRDPYSTMRIARGQFSFFLPYVGVKKI